MRAAATTVGAAAFGAFLAMSAAALHAGGPPTEPPRFYFPPDLLTISSGADSLAVAGLAGAAAGLAIVGPVGAARGAASYLLAFLNPLVLAAFLSGPGGLLYFAAALILLTASARLIVRRDHAATAGLGLAAGAAPFIASGALLLFPVLLATAPFLSPWGAAPRRLAGFYAVLAAPFALASLAALYLAWLFDLSLPPPEGALGDAFSSSALRALAGAGLLSVAGSLEWRRGALALAFLAGAAAVFFWRG